MCEREKERKKPTMVSVERVRPRSVYVGTDKTLKEGRVQEKAEYKHVYKTLI